MNIFEALADNEAFIKGSMKELPAKKTEADSQQSRTEIAEVDLAPPMHPPGVRFGCATCNCHDFEGGIHWCWQGKTKSYRNIAFIKSCSGTEGP